MALPLLRRVVSYTFNIILVIIVAWMLYQRWPSVKNAWAMQGSLSPEAQFVTIQGDLMSLPQKDRRLIVFWASWCGPCTIEMARIRDLVMEGHIRADKVLAIALFEDQDTVRRVAHERAYPFVQVADPDGRLAAIFKVDSTPTIFLQDEKGELDWVGTGLSPLLGWRVKHFFDQK